MKKTIVALSITLLVVSLGASVAMASPECKLGTDKVLMLNADPSHDQHKQAMPPNKEGAKTPMKDAACLQKCTPANK